MRRAKLSSSHRRFQLRCARATRPRRVRACSAAAAPQVPLWLAAYLKKRDKCFIRVPEWLEPGWSQCPKGMGGPRAGTPASMAEHSTCSDGVGAHAPASLRGGHRCGPVSAVMMTGGGATARLRVVPRLDSHDRAHDAEPASPAPPQTAWSTLSPRNDGRCYRPALLRLRRCFFHRLPVSACQTSQLSHLPFHYIEISKELLSMCAPRSLPRQFLAPMETCAAASAVRSAPPSLSTTAAAR